MALSTVADLNSYFNLIYERAAFIARHRTLMANLVDVRGARGWMARKIGKRKQATAVSIAENSDYSNPSTMGTDVQATITPGEAIAQASITDRQLETDRDSARSDAETELGSAIAEKIDVDLLGLFDSYTTDKGATGQPLSVARIGAAVAVADYNKARRYGPLTVMLHPYGWHDIWVELGQPAATYANFDELTVQALRDYFVADLLNCRWFTSGNIAIDATPDAVGAVFGARSIMLDVRRPFRLEVERDGSARAYELNATVGYGYKIVWGDEGVKLTHDATEPAGA